MLATERDGRWLWTMSKVIGRTSAASQCIYSHLRIQSPGRQRFGFHVQWGYWDGAHASPDLPWWQSSSSRTFVRGRIDGPTIANGPIHGCRWEQNSTTAREITSYTVSHPFPACVPPLSWKRPSPARKASPLGLHSRPSSADRNRPAGHGLSSRQCST